MAVVLSLLECRSSLPCQPRQPAAELPGNKEELQLKRPRVALSSGGGQVHVAVILFLMLEFHSPQ